MQALSNFKKYTKIEYEYQVQKQIDSSYTRIVGSTFQCLCIWYIYAEKNLWQIERSGSCLRSMPFNRNASSCSM